MPIRKTSGISNASVSSTLPETYEQRLSQDQEWALMEASRHFDEKSAVFQTLFKIAKRLDEIDVNYAIVGGMALFQCGLRRFTEDVGILVTREELKRIHSELDGLGYLPPHQQSKHLRDTETGVRIEFLTTGDFPGDGKPKPVAFPDPAAVSIESLGIRYINLPTLIQLKLASGMSSLNRRKDLADIQQLIQILELPRDLCGPIGRFCSGSLSATLGRRKTPFCIALEK